MKMMFLIDKLINSSFTVELNKWNSFSKTENAIFYGCLSFQFSKQIMLIWQIKDFFTSKYFQKYSTDRYWRQKQEFSILLRFNL